MFQELHQRDQLFRLASRSAEGLFQADEGRDRDHDPEAQRDGLRAGGARRRAVLDVCCQQERARAECESSLDCSRAMQPPLQNEEPRRASRPASEEGNKESPTGRVMLGQNYAVASGSWGISNAVILTPGWFTNGKRRPAGKRSRECGSVAISRRRPTMRLGMLLWRIGWGWHR